MIRNGYATRAVRHSALLALLWSVMAGSGLAQVAPGPIPPANTNGILVGGGWVEATNHQVVRTSSNVVYVVVSDDNPCNSTRSTSAGVIRVYKGSGAQSANSNVPTSFAEVDAAHHPASAGNGSCIFGGGTSNLLFAPDIKLDSSGIIHIAYIDPNSTNNGKVYYQTFDTNTDLWGTRVRVATGAETNVGGGWPRGSHAVLALDANDTPYIVFASGGTSNSIRWVAKTASGGTAWTTAATISGASGTNQFQPSLVTALDGTLHLAWCDNCLATHPNIKYAKFSAGAWGPVETVSSGDVNVLGDGDHDQIPAIATDLSGRPYVLFLDGTVNGSNDYVRLRYRSDGGAWMDDTPPGVSGPSNPNGTWYCHTPTNYISSTNDIYVFLGHDAQISPGPYQYQAGGVGNDWSAVNQLDPRNQTNVTTGSPGLDGSASVRFDPLRDNNPGLIDLIYYDENDGTPGYAHHATVYYKAVDMNPAKSPVLSVSAANLAFSAVQGGANPAPSTVNVINAGTGTLPFTAASDSSWLTVSPASGNAPQNLTVATDVTGLTPGRYTGHVTVTSSGVQGSPATVTVTLTVSVPITMSSVTLSPTSVVGGNSSTGTVTLSGSAPAGGIVVTLNSNNPAAQVPASVTVAVNANTANFAVTTTSVANSTPATISGTYNTSTQSGTLTVNPPSLTSVSLNPTRVVGGNSSSGTVTLSGKAPSSGIVVTLTSNNPAAQVPASVTVPANASTVNFAITTNSVANMTTATISGTYNGTTLSGALTLDPLSLSTITVNPASVVGGNSSTGTVTLNGKAPSGGVVVALSSDSSAAQVPASVTVPANATTSNFTVTTTGVSTTTAATISGNYNSQIVIATLTVTPSSVPQVTLSSLSVNPNSVVGGNNSTGTVTLSGAAPLGGATVTLSSNNTSAQVPASVTVAAGATTGTLTITTSVVSTSTSAIISAQYGTTQSATLGVTPPAGVVLFGSQSIQPQLDSNSRGSAEAFQTTASASGNLTTFKVYLDAVSTATTVFVGLYADNGGHPGTLITQASSTQLVKGSWNTIVVPGVPITSGMKYWIAILGTTSGTPYFRDLHNGPCKSETSLQSTLTSLPVTWNTGTVYTDCPLSAYGQ